MHAAPRPFRCTAREPARDVRSCRVRRGASGAPFLLAWLLVVVAAVAGIDAAQAAVPHEKAVPAYAEEQTIRQLEQGLEEPGMLSPRSGIHHFDRHYIVPPGNMVEQDVILQRGGNTWRVLRNGPIAATAAGLMIATLLGIAWYYSVKGPLPSPPESGERVLRFSGWQRFVHWATAIVFVLLALTGLLLLYGKKTLLPLIGHDAFSVVALISKYIHNFSGPLFVLLSLLMFFTFVRHNHFIAADGLWLRKLGGMFSHEHVPSGYFNAGEKLWFWGFVVWVGLLMGVSGLILNFPYFGEVGNVTGFGRYALQWANYLHLVGAALYIAVSLGHIYLGTIGSPGAWHAMAHGTVDRAWAREHHELWHDDLVRGEPGTPPLGDRRSAPGAAPITPRGRPAGASR